MQDGLLLRYRGEDGLAGSEGMFLACTFWLVACLARQRKKTQATRIFKHACASANDLGLFAEEYSTSRAAGAGRRGGEMLGNFPQGLTHLAHIGAALSLLDVKHPRG
jgi:GH15 family glucan-1,4-alpha-glucosidase